MTEPAPSDQTTAIIKDYLSGRLDIAGVPPGMREAIESRLTERTEETSKRSEAQIKQLRARGPGRPPAYYAYEEDAEDALQAAAAGTRTALAMAGQVVDPIPFERQIARRLATSATWAIRSEGARVPRPSTRPSRLAWSLAPVPWIDTGDAPWPPPEASELMGRHRFIDTEPALCAEPPYEGWAQIGLLERQFTFESRSPRQPSRQMLLAAGLLPSGGQPTSKSLPFYVSRPSIWSRPHTELCPSLEREQAQSILATTAGPLTCLLQFNEELGSPNPGRGAGIHPFLLGPRIELVTLLGLRPETLALRLTLVDDEGPALVCRQWRGFLIHDGNYEPLTPAVHGTDLILRPDLFTQLQTAIEPTRLRLDTTLTL